MNLRHFGSLALPTIATSALLFCSSTAALAQKVNYPVGESATATGYMQALAGSYALDYFTVPQAITSPLGYSYTTTCAVDASSFFASGGVFGDPICETAVSLLATGLPNDPFLPGASTQVAMNAANDQLLLAITNDGYNRIDIQRSGHEEANGVRYECWSENADNDAVPAERGNRFTTPVDVVAATTMVIETTLTRNDQVSNGVLSGVSDLRVIVLRYNEVLQILETVYTTQNLQLSALQQPNSLSAGPEMVLLTPGRHYVQVFFRAGCKLVAGVGTCTDKLAQSSTTHYAFVDVAFQ